MNEIAAVLTRKRFGWITIALSFAYFVPALYSIITTLFIKEIRNYGMSPLSIFGGALLIGVGILRVNVGRVLIKEDFDKGLFKTIFALVCFLEILLGSICGLIVVDEYGIIGIVIVALFVIYYILALLFFRTLK